jgi:hypothetical protein
MFVRPANFSKTAVVEENILRFWLVKKTTKSISITRKKSKSFWKSPTANTEVRPIKTQVPIAVKWPNTTQKPSFSIFPMARSATAPAGMLFVKEIGNGNIKPRPAITIANPINRSIVGPPLCRNSNRGRTNFSSLRATLMAPVSNWFDQTVARRRFMMKRGSHGSRPIARDAPIKQIAIPKGVAKPGMATKQNGNAKRGPVAWRCHGLSALFQLAQCERPILHADVQGFKVG